MFNLIRQRCCGLDVHQAIVWACLMIVQADGSIAKTIRRFTTMTNDLLKLRDWLEENQCQYVVMESTGVYWKPIYNILEDVAEITLANAHQVKNLPGRKTDVKDCEWLAQMHLCGLVRASFVPPRPIRDLRELTRRRRKLVDNANSEKNRIQKILEDANIKLSAVVSRIWGVSCREMLEALISGGYTPEEMANFARARMRKKLPELKEALTGKITDEHRFILTQCMEHIQFLEKQIAAIEEQIDEKLKAYAEVYECLMSIPFFAKISTAGFIAEMGADMSPFLTGAHAASWAGLCPGNHESAGKRKSGKTRHGNKYLESLAVEVAWAAIRRKDTYLRAKFQRLAYRRGPRKAILAIAHSIIKIVYHLIKERVCYLEPEIKEPPEPQKRKMMEKHLKALERLGYKVEIALATDMQLQVA
ncbi:IS110 family transposase [candidate division KSB1 bacterium]|nr:IS110 family transposase [candidate division KSB1 bacterium]